MSEIERFNYAVDMVECSDGDYVRYSDLDAQAKRIEDLQEENLRLKAAINRVRQGIAIGSWNINPQVAQLAKDVNDLFEKALSEGGSHGF